MSCSINHQLFHIHIFSLLNVRYFSNLKLVFKNKYVVSFPSFNDSLVSFQSDKYFWLRHFLSDCYKNYKGETLHLKICKYILGLNKKSVNYASLSELGRHPLHYDKTLMLVFIPGFKLRKSMLQLTSMCNNRILIIRTLNSFRDRRGHDGMVVWFTATCVSGVCHH
jgi:hypothetical protein